MVNFFQKFCGIIKKWQEEARKREEEQRKLEEERRRLEEEERKKREMKLKEDLRKIFSEILDSGEAEKIKKVLEYFMENPNYLLSFQTLKSRFSLSQTAISKLLGYGIFYKTKDSYGTYYGLSSKFLPLIPIMKEVLDESKNFFIYRSKEAKAELEEIKKMDEEFNKYLINLLNNRLKETIDFGKSFNVKVLADYLRNLFGEVLYFDSLLAIAQQYGMTDTEMLNPKGKVSLRTGFHLALFGAPGTGKTFAIRDMILGNEREGVPAHGLVGRNRYCGGMTAAKFVRIGEAYQGRRFNFVIPEFNDWFKYKGMVEPLKLALEQGIIRVETKEESIGPYRFNSFFSTNYNTEVGEGMYYEVTISDPNFNAIEDRMLVRLHKMTRERYEELRRAQRKLAMGEMEFNLAQKIRDHLNLVYAIQTENPLIRNLNFKKKKI
jgi:hypothetical protein